MSKDVQITQVFSFLVTRDVWFIGELARLLVLQGLDFPLELVD